MTPCHRCHAPAYVAGVCQACIAAERAAIKPFVGVALDCLEALGWEDLVREVRRRMALYEVEQEAPCYEGLMQ